MRLLAHLGTIPIFCFIWMVVGFDVRAEVSRDPPVTERIPADVRQLLREHLRATGEQVELLLARDPKELEAEIALRAEHFASQALDSSKWLLLGFADNGAYCAERSSLPLQSLFESEDDLKWCAQVKKSVSTNYDSEAQTALMVRKVAAVVLRALHSPLELSGLTEELDEGTAPQGLSLPFFWSISATLIVLIIAGLGLSHRIARAQGLLWIITKVPPLFWPIYSLGLKGRAIGLIHLDLRRAILSPKAIEKLGISSEQMEQRLHSQAFESILARYEPH